MVTCMLVFFPDVFRITQCKMISYFYGSLPVAFQRPDSKDTYMDSQSCLWDVLLGFHMLPFLYITFPSVGYVSG